MRWVERNEDKPHRCPECHAVATWEHNGYGPRTILRCPKDCNVQWRAHHRTKRQSMQWKNELRDGFPTLITSAKNRRKAREAAR